MIRVLAIGRPMVIVSVASDDAPDRRPDGRLRRPVHVPELAGAIDKRRRQVGGMASPPHSAFRSRLPVPARLKQKRQLAGVACSTVISCYIDQVGQPGAVQDIGARGDDDGRPDAERQPDLETCYVEGQRRHRQQTVGSTPGPAASASPSPES